MARQFLRLANERELAAWLARWETFSGPALYRDLTVASREAAQTALEALERRARRHHAWRDLGRRLTLRGPAVGFDSREAAQDAFELEYGGNETQPPAPLFRPTLRRQQRDIAAAFDQTLKDRWFGAW